MSRPGCKSVCGIHQVPPAGRIICDAIEAFRDKPSQFELKKFIRQYSALSDEALEAFVVEIESEMCLEGVFERFRNSSGVGVSLSSEGLMVLAADEEQTN